MRRQRRWIAHPLLRSALLAAALSADALTQAQAAAPAADDSLTWRGITLYGAIDIGLQYESHGAPFSDFYTPASTNIIQKAGREKVTGATGSNESQSKVGLRGREPIVGDWSGVFALETWFNPQAGQLSNSLKSLIVNNGLATDQQKTSSDGASAGQLVQIAYVGIHSDTFGTLTFGRQQTLVADGITALDPNLAAPAFSLLGASGTYAGAGTTEDKRLDSTVKYLVSYADSIHFGALFIFNDSYASAGGTGFQANIGGHYAGLTIDTYYSKIYDAVSATSLSATQVAGLSKLGFTSDNSLSATISDNTTLAIMAAYTIDPIPVKLYAGYERIQYANPTHPLAAGVSGLGGYTLAFVSNTAYSNDKKLDVYWAGVRYSVLRPLAITAAFYGFRQNAYGTGSQAGCASVAFSTCSGSFRAYSLDADYRFTKRFDIYAGAMYSAVSDGAASGYLDRTNINPTIGARFIF
ncbi:MAG TPA: porin [Steroidobacteraceae bacterium]|jgi:predicted porin|nr:porin [Steroidobacteraceae bacterium]